MRRLVRAPLNHSTRVLDRSQQRRKVGDRTESSAKLAPPRIPRTRGSTTGSPSPPGRVLPLPVPSAIGGPPVGPSIAVPAPSGSPPPYTAPVSPPLRSRSVPQLANSGFAGFAPSSSPPTTWLPPILDGRVRFHETGIGVRRPGQVRSSSSSLLVNGQPVPDRLRPTEEDAYKAFSSTAAPYASGVREEYADDEARDADEEDAEALEIPARARTSSRRPFLPHEFSRTDAGPALRRVVSEQGPPIPESSSTASAPRPAAVEPPPPPDGSPPRRRKHIYTPILIFLNFLAVLPGLLGFLYSAARFYSTRHLIWASVWDARSAGGVTEARSTRLDWFISGLWALATAYFTLSLARGLMRRWLVYYSTVPTIIRVVSLQAICWPLALTTHRVLSFDQPVAAWMICATTAAFCNVIQSWVTSNIVERKDRPDRQRWRLFSLAVTAVLGPGVRTDKYRKGERVLSWKRVLWGTVLPFALLGWFTANALLWQQYVARYLGGGGIDLGHPRLNVSAVNRRVDPAPAGFAPAPPADVRVMVLVASSWNNYSSSNRHTFRETSVRLFPRASSSITVDYRFLLGTAPSPHTATRSGPGIEAEAEEFGDMLLVPAHDTDELLSKKIHEGWKWAAGLDVDYVLKTDDDIFVRMDVVAKELSRLGRRREYWRGFAYWDIPAVKDASNKNADFSYELPSFPPYTAGALHILSKDLVELVAPPSGSRLFVKNEDQNLGLWLHPSGVRPIHDHRIQQAQVCENDMIAKHFGSQYTEPNGFGPREMYANVVAGRKQCEGFLQRWCGVCYPSCRGRDNHWRTSGFACDDLRGATLAEKPGLPSPAVLDPPIRVPPEPIVIGGPDDPWIIPGILSRHASPFSATADWHLLHMLCWHDAVDTFQERHFQVLETIWAHEPRAVLLLFSTTLPEDFLADFARQGYSIHVVRVGKEELLANGWYLGPQSRLWLEKWEEWEAGPNFSSHLTDYLRYIFLYRYGGTYLDMDAPWLRSAPSSTLEYIGADYSTLAGDLDWTLDEDGLYLAPGVMRFRRGWTVFRDAAEQAFSVAYTVDCVGCVGPRAITKAIGARRYQLEQYGLTIVPSRVLYPRNWIGAHELVRTLPTGEARAELERLAQSSWSVHLFGRMTDHLRIQPGSLAAEAFAAFSLGVPRRTGRLSSGDDELARPSPAWTAGPSLRFPKRYTYRSRVRLEQRETPDVHLLGSLDGRFDGVDLIALRGVPVRFSGDPNRLEATVRLSTTAGGRIALTTGAGSAGAVGRTPDGEADPAHGASFAVRLAPGQATLRTLNAILRGVLYLPPLPPPPRPPTSAAPAEPATDCLRIELKWGNERVTGDIEIDLSDL